MKNPYVQWALQGPDVSSPPFAHVKSLGSFLITSHLYQDLNVTSVSARLMWDQIKLKAAEIALKLNQDSDNLMLLNSTRKIMDQLDFDKNIVLKRNKMNVALCNRRPLSYCFLESAIFHAGFMCFHLFLWNSSHTFPEIILQLHG